jgi:hypothetical protein
MSRSDRLKAALVALADDRRTEIDAIRDLHSVDVHLTFDDAGCIEYVALSYEMKRHRQRLPRDRSHVA